MGFGLGRSQDAETKPTMNVQPSELTGYESVVKSGKGRSAGCYLTETPLSKKAAVYCHCNLIQVPQQYY